MISQKRKKTKQEMIKKKSYSCPNDKVKKMMPKRNVQITNEKVKKGEKKSNFELIPRLMIIANQTFEKLLTNHIYLIFPRNN